MSLRGVLDDTIGTGGGLFQGAALPQSAVRPSGLFGVGTDFQAGHHEIHECVPTGKEPITGESAQIIEESLAGGQVGADQPIVPSGEGEECVMEKGQDVHGCQERREMFFAMAEVMFEVIALGFKSVVVFVFDLPSDPGRGHEGGDVLVGDLCKSWRRACRQKG